MVDRLFGFAGIALLGIFVGVSKLRVPPKDTICEEVRTNLNECDKATFFSEKEFLSLLKKKGLSPIGKPSHSINTDSIEKFLKSNKYIQHVACYRNINGGLRLLVEQKEPLFQVAIKENPFFVTSRRTIIPTSLSYKKELLVIKGSVSEEFSCEELFDFVQYVKANPIRDSLVVGIQVDANEELIITPSLGNFKILFGKPTDIEEKFDNLLLFYKQGIRQVGWNRYSKINLKYANQVVCTLK